MPATTQVRRDVATSAPAADDILAVEKVSHQAAITVRAEGVLFDNDGVLVDSITSVTTAWSRCADACGLDPEIVNDMVHGRRAADTIALLIDSTRRNTALTDINSLEVQDATSVTAIPGAIALTGAITAGRWAVVTSGDRTLATARLAAAGIKTPTSDGHRRRRQQRQAASGGIPFRRRATRNQPRSCRRSGGRRGGRARRQSGRGRAVIGVGPRALDSDADIVIHDLTSVSWTADGLLINPAGILREPAS